MLQLRYPNAPRQQNSQKPNREGVSHHLDGSDPLHRGSTSAPRGAHHAVGPGSPHREPVRSGQPRREGAVYPSLSSPGSLEAPVLPGQMGPATRLANAKPARSPPANVNRAVGRSECCQALIKASCLRRPRRAAVVPFPLPRPIAVAQSGLVLLLCTSYPAHFGIWKKSFGSCQELPSSSCGKVAPCFCS